MIEIKRPLVIRIESTMKCNHKCRYCYNPRDRYKSLGKEEAKEHIKRLVHIANKWGAFDITFTGGEPFMERDLLYTGIKAVKETGMDFGINTNASLIRDADAKYLKDNSVASIFASFPSLKKDKFEAVTRVPGSYKHALKGFQSLSNEGLRITANMVVIKNPVNNISDVYETGKMLIKNFGIRRFCTAPISPNYKDHEKYIISHADVLTVLEQLISLHEEFGVDIRNSRPLPICFLEGIDPKFAQYDFFRGCTIGVVNGMTINLEGNLKPCPVVPFFIANAFTDTLDDIMQKMANYDGSDVGRLKAITPQCCLGCSVLDICKGGCKAEALALKGDIKAKSRFKKNIQTNEQLMTKVMANKDLVNTPCFKIRRSIKYRQDSDDIYVIRAELFAVLNKQEFDFFQYLYTLDEFSPKSIVDRYKLNIPMFNLFLNKLDKARALIEVG